MSYELKNKAVTTEKLDREIKAILYDMKSKNVAVREDACYKWVKLEERFQKNIPEERRKEVAKLLNNLKHYNNSK